MVKLVQTLEMLPTCDLATQPMIQFHFAFALNRWSRLQQLHSHCCRCSPPH